MNPNPEVIKLAKQIIELDILRDEIWEQLLQKYGHDAYVLLRNLENGIETNKGNAI
ncbi:hypothetical protein [Bacillus sp. Marseille-P3661]|uniref:hypothetical protein n=1 Tax=Bacillus sp. Marseille-P3661 TaxID=1936234 RepID=UPI0015E19B7F|nr:hypothetical protein [Bacillus sp. Marseille-P3661]